MPKRSCGLIWAMKLAVPPILQHSTLLRHLSTSELAARRKPTKACGVSFYSSPRTTPRVPAELRRFLSQAYDLKSVADYATGPDSFVPLDLAAAAIDTARRFPDCVVVLLDTP
jgi:hypothetical protein